MRERRIQQIQKHIWQSFINYQTFVLNFSAIKHFLKNTLSILHGPNTYLKEYESNFMELYYDYLNLWYVLNKCVEFHYLIVNYHIINL